MSLRTESSHHHTLHHHPINNPLHCYPGYNLYGGPPILPLYFQGSSPTRPYLVPDPYAHQTFPPLASFWGQGQGQGQSSVPAHLPPTNYLNLWGHGWNRDDDSRIPSAHLQECGFNDFKNFASRSGIFSSMSMNGARSRSSAWPFSKHFWDVLGHGGGVGGGGDGSVDLKEMAGDARRSFEGGEAGRREGRGNGLGKEVVRGKSEFGCVESSSTLARAGFERGEAEQQPRKTTHSEEPKFDFSRLAQSATRGNDVKVGRSRGERGDNSARVSRLHPFPAMSYTAIGHSTGEVRYSHCATSTHCPSPNHNTGQKQRRKRQKKEFICQYCQRHFTKSYNLLIHERTHTDERPFRCDLCIKTFRRKDHLRDHRYTHFSQKPYTCVDCGKGFCQFRTLTVHRSTHQSTTAQ